MLTRVGPAGPTKSPTATRWGLGASPSSAGERVRHLPEAPGSRRRNPHNGGVGVALGLAISHTHTPRPPARPAGWRDARRRGYECPFLGGVGRPGKDHDSAQPAVLICTVGVMLLLGALGAPGSGGPQQALVSAGGVVLGQAGSEPGHGHCTDTCNSHNSSSKNHTGLNIGRVSPDSPSEVRACPCPWVLQVSYADLLDSLALQVHGERHS